jgi:hypothetical protein
VPLRTCQWAPGYQINPGGMVANAPQVYDVGLNDHTTYYEHSDNGVAAVSCIWDLGAPSEVTRVVYSLGYMDSVSLAGGFGIEASNDGSTWVNPITGINPTPGMGGPFDWYDIDDMDLDGVFYRFWRVSVRSATNFQPDPMIARVGDFRLFDGGGAQYTIGGTDDSRVVHGVGRVVLAPFPVQNIEYCIATALWHAHRAAGILRRRTKKLWRTISSFVVRHPSPVR